MATDFGISGDAIQIALAVQLAIAPIFLLVGTGSLLAVMTQRLARVVDRARFLEERIESGALSKAEALSELQALDRRISLANCAIAACSAATLFVCAMIATLFVGELAGWEVRVAIAVLFIVTMALLMVGITSFLIEIGIATKSLRVRRDLLVGHDTALSEADQSRG